MKRIRTVVLALVAVAALILVLAKVAGKQIGYVLFTRAVSLAIDKDITTSLPDGLHLALCGAGSPMPDPTRAGPCVAVIAGNRMFVIDAGRKSEESR